MKEGEILKGEILKGWQLSLIYFDPVKVNEEVGNFK
jgi:hypothetical protein